ncbi:MAG TPA: hypothetical protein VGJ24_09690 [Nocardioides sp.]
MITPTDTWSAMGWQAVQDGGHVILGVAADLSKTTLTRGAVSLAALFISMTA